MTRRTSKKYRKTSHTRDKEYINHFLSDLKKLEQELHRKQENQENDEEGED